MRYLTLIYFVIQICILYAHASSFQNSSQDDGTVIAEAEIAYSPQQMIELLNDPEKMSRIDGDIKVEILKENNNCKDIRYTIPHFIMNIEYVAQACLEDQRIELILLESDDLSEFSSHWLIRATEEGSHITYSIRSIPKFPLPIFIVRSQTQSGVETFFTRLLAHIASPEAKP